ncbi:MAG: hypothetical protein LBC97_12655 [Bifidobacteriaceae bacterium]|jgi:hypothetical protein|nr:hypothetical protein [Bifidobacteriaceae bacterium]
MNAIRETAGLTDWQARQVRREGTRMAVGFYLEPGDDPDSLVNRVSAALAAAPPGSMATGVTGFALAGLPLPARNEREAAANVHLLMPKGAGRRHRRPGVVTHLFNGEPPAAWLTPGQIPVADLRQCWVDAVRHLALRDPWEIDPQLLPIQRGRFNTERRRAWLQAVQMGDVLVRRQQAPTSLADFGRHMARLAPSPGTRLIRAAFAAVRAGTDSLPETQIRLAVMEAGFPEPAVNLEVEVAGSRRYLDLCWPDQWIDLEYQGSDHFSDPAQVKADMRRRGELQRGGWTIVEAATRDLGDPGQLFGRLAAAFHW